MEELTKLTIDRLRKPWVYGRRLNVKTSMHGGEGGERRQRGLLYAGNVTVGMHKGAQPGRYKGCGERNIKQGNIQQQNKIRDKTDTRTIGQDIRSVIRNMI